MDLLFSYPNEPIQDEQEEIKSNAEETEESIQDENQISETEIEDIIR